MTELSDAEVVCGFMEAVPGFREIDYPVSVGGWWRRLAGERNKRAVALTLDALHLVEAKLTGAQRLEYWLELSSGGKPETGYWRILHATAEQKLKALAAVLRGAGAAH